ncbi:MAG: AlpA family phage regulatory protein [Pantoea sp.]|uniref:helix-turn-helix transcriptional regulator n=1 Tax=Pantoea sp. TaxID=69393 RepID=UPI0039E4ADF4
MLDKQLIPEKDVMEKLGITSRTTMWKYCKNHNFPKPVRSHPKAYLRKDVDGWIRRGGINQPLS